MKRRLDGLLVYLAFSILWSWPLILDPFSSVVSLHFDQLPAAWLVHAAPSFRDGISELSAWPAGEPLVRLDSFLFLILAMLLQGLVPGLFLTNLFVLLGPVCSAWAAEKLAREGLKVEGPAALLAGLAFGFAPLATVAVLEGHVYYLLNPWLPLCVLHLLRNTPRDDAWAGLHWLLCLLTTAYMGVNATLLGGVLVFYRFFKIEKRIPWYFLGICGVSGLLYAALFVAGGGQHSREEGDALVRLGSASLATLVAWNPWMDLNRHSLAPAVGVAPLALALLSPAIRLPGWKLWLGLGLGCLVLAVGPVLELGVARMEAWPTLLYPLLKAGLFDTYRFPIRFAWVSSLCLGLLAARLVARSRWPGLFVALVAIDCLFLSGAFLRMRAHPLPIPSLYQLLPAGAVLELYPEVGGTQEDMAFYQQNLSCYYQVGHGHPILERCLNTDMAQSPRLAAGRELQHRLLDSEGSVRDALNALQVKSVMVHLDLFQSHERGDIVSGLNNALGPPLGESRDGGEWLMAWELR